MFCATVGVTAELQCPASSHQMMGAGEEADDEMTCAVQHFDVMMYGDTLIEAWRGTILGEPSLRVQGCSEIFHSHFGHKYRTAVY